MAVAACALAWLRVADPLFAHPLAPALLELRELADGAVEVTWRQSRFQLPGSAAKRPVLPAHCTPKTSARISDEPGSLTAAWTVDCAPAGLVAARVGVEGLDDMGGDALIRVRLRDGRVVRAVVDGGDPYLTIPARESWLDVVRSYAKLGFEHILTGTDHLLFVFGLLLLVGGGRLLIATITAFTLGHSITLSLAVVGLARVPSGPIEALIAASVFLLAVEIAREGDGRRSLLRRRPWAMAALFGLLHGLGFAGALREIGLPDHEIPLSLFSFNVGIELGQLSFVGALLVAMLVLRPAVARLPAAASRVPAYLMGSFAAMWTIERSLEIIA